MKTKIENDKEFAAAIDQYGDALAEIETQKAEADVLKQMLESYALENKVNRQATDKYVLTMKKESPALRRAAGVNECDVVAELKRSETGKAYLVHTYDNKALKRDLAGTDAGREQLAAFGLYLTEPQKHVEVKAR